ncbi:O-antigen ligase family protein [Paenibacillus sp. P26]|nr:O-antigen ligase family protein [Paenibacillus sp. P26]
MAKPNASPYKNPYRSPKAAVPSEGSGLYGILLSFVVLFLILAPYNRGLFLSTRIEFDGKYTFLGFYYPVYIAYLCVFAALLLMAWYVFRHWKPEGWTAYALLYVWLIPLLYLAAVFHAASPYMALQGLYSQLMYAAFFVIGAGVVQKRSGAVWTAEAMLAAGYFIVIYGLLYWFGNIPDTAAAIIVENRLTSIFTYANSYAAFLIALMFAGLYRSVTAARAYERIIHALFLAPVFLSSLLTLSRGGLVLIPVILLCVLPFLRLAKQAALLFNLVVSTVAALLLSSYATNAGLALQKAFSLSGNMTVWAVTAAGSAASALIIWAFAKLVVPRLDSATAGWKTFYNRFAMAGAAIIVMGLGLLVLQIPATLSLLPQSLQNRLESINLEQHSVLERGYFYKDAMKIVADYPVWGAGGGGWSALYQQYQSYPYSSRQAHNYIMQTWIEVGTVGLAVVAMLILWVAFVYIRHWFKGENAAKEEPHLVYLIVAGSILAHSAIDFDMSYAYLSALVFLSLGAMLGVVRFKPKSQEAVSPETSRVEAAKAKARGPLGWVLPSICAVVSCVMLVFSLQMLTANVQTGRVVAKLRTGSANINEILPPLNKALSLHPSNVDVALAADQPAV